ncbi:ABC transporter ATP-binding protein [Actinomyces sp. oral taxon 170]|uniref:ABC transporter ATP-binding protein n=1 Tax=Actinomyces sp. oral taxon 170 TaxID=712117 RepID=UPI000205B31C|nr:ABC transporter ATP-binding protein [Actinomyces sp. oral taxon 170]EGF55221.1 ABC transporter, ATP-binding protein [Actinomyces sp. oral taxon 170 str. F0386]
MSKQTTPSAPPSTSQPVTSQSLLAEPAPTVERAAESHPADSGGPEASAQTGTGGNAQRSREGQAAIARLGAPIRIRLRIGQVLVLLSAVLAVAPYIALVQLGDILLDAYRAGVSPDSQRVHSAVMVLVSAYSARLLLYFMALLITHLADLSLRDRLRRDIVERISHAPLAWFTESTSGRIRKAVQDDTTTVHTVIAHGPVERLNAIVTPLALLICAFWIDWRLALLALSTLILYVLTYSASLRGMNEKTVEMDRKLAAVSSSMVEFVSGIGVVKAFGRVGRAHSAYLTAADEFSSFYRAWAMPLVTVACLSFTWVSIPVLLLVNLGGGALLMHAGTVTLPQVLTTTLIALVLPGALTTVASISWSYQLAGAAALRLCEVLDTPVLPISDSPERPQSARVEIEHVSFSYGDTLAVDDASLILEPGTVTALLGPSGSGKSTLATLIARFADPDAGAVRIGGVDLRDMDEDTLYSTVSFILQDAQLLGTTVRENISLGRPDADLEQVRAAARVARIDEEIMALPDGYDTVLGQDTGLSGGQEQRIAIARAILLNTPVILLDEATAMADPESEAEIQEALSALVEDRTVLVIAHRPAAVRGAHRIAVMDRGRIVACGSHDDLLDEPHYRALLRQTGELDDVETPVTEKTAKSSTSSPALSPDSVRAEDEADDVTVTRGPAGTGSPRSTRSLLARFHRLMVESSWRRTRSCLILAAANGITVGLALLVLLPATVSLGSGAPRWGLSFGNWLLILIVLGIGAAALEFQGQRKGMSGALGFMHDVHHAVGDQIARLPLRWFTSDSAGTLSRAVSQEMVSLGESAAHFMYRLTSTTAACVVVWAGSWAWDWRLGLLLTVAAPVLAGFVRIARRLLDHGKSISEPAERELATRVVEIARCQGALRSCRAATGYSRLTAAFDDGARASGRALWWETAGNIVNGALSQVIIVALITLTASRAVGGTMEPLVAVAIIGMCLRFTTMIDEIGANVMGMEERRQMMNHLDAVMDAELMAEPEGRTDLPEPGAVGLDDVVFGYRTDMPVLDGVSLDVPARSMCAIVGPSGSGKTTIARLLARFWDVDSGTVRVGGTDVRDMPTAQLMEQLSMVFQDVYLFDDTLAANIRIGNPVADDEQIRWAADLAGVTEIVERLPHGWDTRVGEGGRALSGGERQRVSIARALLKRAPIVLLDEATSALDAENEANIVAAMEELRRTSTLIVIAHKLETIAAADQVIVLDDAGHVAQRGRHEDLVEVEGPYRSFWEQRTRARGWALV